MGRDGASARGEDSTEMKKVFHLGFLLKIHRDRNILELTISPAGLGQLLRDDRIQSSFRQRRHQYRLQTRHKTLCKIKGINVLSVLQKLQVYRIELVEIIHEGSSYVVGFRIDEKILRFIHFSNSPNLFCLFVNTRGITARLNGRKNETDAPQNN